ncbi:DUF2490 domain-containing protein [Lacibacter sp. H375]|uniref:DUF2490 domain-containing protein n=1 Tax=Lacibacter sp. H375 TaxID=3133424 RepID=UPI0030BDE85B
MKRKYFSTLLMLLSMQSIIAQLKTTTDVRQIWTGYFNQTRLTDKWGFWADVHLRTKDNYFNNLSQGIVRLGLTYYLTDDSKLTAGYAFINHFPAENHKNISQPEHRPWQQIQWHTKYPKLKLMQWFRLEERYRRKIKNNDELADGYNFNFRLRYNILSQFPLSKKRFQPHTFSFVLSNEVFVNFGKQIVYNMYDQNRFFAGFHYHVNKHDNLQVGYMNVYQQLAAGNQYRSTHAARVFYFHNLDLRKSIQH